MAISTPRRFKSRHGTYGVRFLVPRHAQAAVGKKEIRISLRTKDPALARQLALQLCLEFERRRMSDRKKKPADELALGWVMTLPNGVSFEVTDDADQARWDQMNARDPNFIERAAGLPGSASARPLPDKPQVVPVRNPIQLDKLIAKHLKSLEGHAGLNSRTIREKRLAFDNLLEYLQSHHQLPPDSFAHTVKRAMLVDFLEWYAQRPAKADTQGQISADTLSKVCGHLTKLFKSAWVDETLESELAEGLREGVKARQRARTGKRSASYLAITQAELSKIYDPEPYLVRLNRPDYFWAPLLAVTLGARLKEIVTTRIEEVVQDPDSGVWVITFPFDRTKNDQSVRSVPIAQQILDAGFLDYWTKVKDLGSPILFPFGDFESRTWQDLPSKNVSRRFGLYLDDLGLTEDQKVFHSLRKNVISTLNVMGVPSGDRRLIAGHAEDDERQLMRDGPRADVHMDTYTQAERISIGGKAPMARLKEHLDQAAAVQPINWKEFAVAARIVLDTVKQRAPGSRDLSGGWHTNAAAVREEKTALLRSQLSSEQTP